MKAKISLALIVVALGTVFYGAFAWGVEQKTEASRMEDQKMLFLCYWELNENMPAMQHVQIAKMLTEAGLFPPEGVEIIRFDKTPDNWGVTLFKADSAEAASGLITLWRVSAPGFFKMVKMSPALPVKEAAANAARMYQSIKEAEAEMKEKAASGK